MSWRRLFDVAIFNDHAGFSLSVVIATGLLAVSTPALGQVRWRSGEMLEIQAAPQAQAALVQRLGNLVAGPNDRAPRARHVVVALDRPVTPGARAELEASGIRLERYLGDNCFFALLDAPRLDTARAAQLGLLRNAFDIKRRWKLHPDLNAGVVQPWTIVQDPAASKHPAAASIEARKRADARTIVAAVVLFHDDVGLDGAALGDVRRHGGQLISTITPLNGLLISIPFGNISAMADEDNVQYIEPPLPMLGPSNTGSRAAQGADIVQASPFNLTGSGVDVLVYDVGKVFMHADFSGRVTWGTPDNTLLSDHSTHVAGTIAGNGSLSAGANRGMAPQANIISYGFETTGGFNPGFLFTDPGDLQADYTGAIFTHGADIANNSIASNVASNGLPCAWEGNYGVTGALIDSIVHGDLGQGIPVVWAVGNERGNGRCGTSYGTVPPPAGAKNHLAVGAINSNDKSMTIFSSWGPTDDGRLKPDVVASGCQSSGDYGVTSTSATPLTTLDYNVLCGTSMAAPATTGVATLLIEDYRVQFPATPDPLPSTVKTLIVQSAVDLFTAGPDYMSGYGNVRADLAIATMRTGDFFEDLTNQGQRAVAVATVAPGATSLKITLAWDDVPGTPNVLPALVNDLDLIVHGPSGQRAFPWTLGGVANPAAPAVQDKPNHVDNLEQVLVLNPEPGQWLIEIVGYNVPLGPQIFSLVSSAPVARCTDQGVVSFDANVYACTSPALITLVDCGLNLDPLLIESALVTVTSSTDPVGAVISLNETSPDSATFVGTVNIGVGGDVVANGGDMLNVSYNDADTGAGLSGIATDGATIDCTPPVITGVLLSNISGLRAEVFFTSDEPSIGTVRFGTTCQAPTGSASQDELRTGHTLELTNLAPNTQYFVSIEAVDEAGNLTIEDNALQCFSFMTLDLPDSLTEFFEASDNDLSNRSIEFTPIPGMDRYSVCVSPISQLPTNPMLGQPLFLGDDGPLPNPIVLTGNKQVRLFGTPYSSLFPNPNGHITFLTGDEDWTPSLADHFAVPRISALFIDLSPQLGTVAWQQTADRIVFTFYQVPQFQLTDSNTFQYELFFDGRIRLSYLEIGALNAMIGLSDGTGAPLEFFETDLSVRTLCPPTPARAFDSTVNTPVAQSVIVDLGAFDDGLPSPPGAMVVTLTSLPQNGVLVAPGGGSLLTNVPVDLPLGVTTITYVPLGTFSGTDSLSFIANDGGTAPSGGPSSLATVQIAVGNVVPIVPILKNGVLGAPISLNMLWAVGNALGQGGAADAGGGGLPDPTSGITQSTILSYNQFGNYEANISQPKYATIGPIDCTDCSQAELAYFRWLGVESSAFDHATVEVSLDNGSTWIIIWEHQGISLIGGEWTPITHFIGDLIDGKPSVMFRWGMGPTDTSIQYAGWNLDEIELLSIAPQQPCPGDGDFNRTVNFNDITLTLSNWGKIGATQREGDTDANGVVNFNDITTSLSNWGAVCPP